jgi:hypothetical protein
MGWLTPTDRLRARLHALIKHGDQVGIARESARRRKPRPGLNPQNLSYFLHGHRKRPLSFDDLDDIAFYFNCMTHDYPSAVIVAAALSERPCRPDVVQADYDRVTPRGADS